MTVNKELLVGAQNWLQPTGQEGEGAGAGLCHLLSCASRGICQPVIAQRQAPSLPTPRSNLWNSLIL